MTKPGIYQHHKGPFYRVLHVATEATTGPLEGRRVVIYQRVQSVGVISGVERFTTESSEPVWVRDEREFESTVDGQCRRFTLIREAS